MIERDNRAVMTPKEREEFEQEKTVAEMQTELTLKLKEMELEIAKIETRWSVLLKLPLAIVLLPVRLLLAVAYIVAVARKHEPADNFWEFMGVKKTLPKERPSTSS